MKQITERDQFDRVKVRYERDHWTEYFTIELDFLFVQHAAEGDAIKRFFLPVYRNEMRAAWVCWVWPLAPFVLFGIALGRAFSSLWSDVIWAVDTWRDWVSTSHN